MSTHKSPCLMCGKPTYCCNDTTILGVEIYTYQRCENSDVSIGEFCSVECFFQLRNKIEENLEMVKEECPELLDEK